MISNRLSIALSAVTWIFGVYVIWYLTFYSASDSASYGIGILPSIAFIAFTIFIFSKRSDWLDNMSASAWVVAFVLSVFTLTGFLFYNDRSFTGVFSNTLETALFIASLVGLVLVLNSLVVVLWNFFSKGRISDLFKIGRSSAFYRFISKRPMLFCALVLALFYLPFIIIYFPASVPHDTMYQLLQFTGFEKFTNHHPWLVTCFYGTLFSIGHSLGNDNIGVFTITCVCTLMQICSYSFAIAKTFKLTDSVLVYIVSLAFFALNPSFPGYAASLVKDGLFMAFFAVFMTSILELAFSKYAGVSQRMLLLISGLLLCLARHNGIYLVLPTLLVLFFVMNRDKVVFAGTVVILIVGFLVNFIAPGILGISPGSSREMLSIPFQQTARYVTTYPNEVTAKEKSAIDAVLNYSSLQEKYDPDVSDYVKNTFKEKSSERDRNMYFSTWIKMGLKHPLVYLDATVDNSYGYIYPFCNLNAMGPFNVYIQERIEEGKLDIHYAFSQEVRDGMDAYTGTWRNIPGISLLLSPGFYTWLVICLLGYSINRKGAKAVMPLYVPVICMVLICIMSPVNGWLRYSLPIIVATPVLCTSALIVGANREKLTKGEEALTSDISSLGRFSELRQ